MREVGTSTETRGEQERRMPTRSTDETVNLGSEIYEREIRHKVEKDHVGMICAIDVDSGCWALGESAREAVKRLREENPEATDTYCERVGYWGLRSFGGSLRRTD